MKNLKFKFLLVLILCFFGFLILELVARYKGYMPGNTSTRISSFRPIEQVIDYNYFRSDSNGLQVANIDCTGFFKDYPLTNSGYRAPELLNGDSVFYIGDSFLWGAGSSKRKFSFYDLLSNGYNYGIPGADPAEYYKVAECYLPSKHVKYVVVCFFMGNDIMKEDRPVEPYCDLFFESNAGNLLGYYQGRYLTINEAYSNAKNYFIVDKSSVLDKVVSQSAFLTLVTKSIPQWITLEREYDKGNYKLVNSYLRGINEIAKQNKQKLIICIIPSPNDLDPKPVYKEIFSGLEFVYWPKQVFEKSDFDKTSHFNDMGHQKFAVFIKEVLKDHQSNWSL